MKAGLKKCIGRNPRHSQERILRAALKEFAAQGFAGARVDTIAHRARINKRMLYHYFGDKKGLFREVLRRKLAEHAAWLASAPDDLVESLPYWFRIACADLEWVRLLEWEALQGGPRTVIDETHRRSAARMAVARLQQRQANGWLPKGLDPAQLLLALMGITAYPLAFPQIARLVTGLSTSGAEFRAQRELFLRQFAAALQSPSGTPRPPAPRARRAPRVKIPKALST